VLGDSPLRRDAAKRGRRLFPRFAAANVSRAGPAIDSPLPVRGPRRLTQTGTRARTTLTSSQPQAIAPAGSRVVDLRHIRFQMKQQEGRQAAGCDG